MLCAALLSAGLLVHAAAALDTTAPVVLDNPSGAAYSAVFVPNDKSTINGDVIVATSPDGTGVTVQLTLGGLPGEDSVADYLYHIHTDPVPADGNCTATLGHLDPFSRGESPPCDASDPASCQVGDLSGKHGVIPAGNTGFTTSYTDAFISTSLTSNASVFNRSIVLHFPNLTRIACANLLPVQLPLNATPPATSSGSTPASASAEPTHSVQPFLGSAGRAAPMAGWLIAAGLVFGIAM